MKRCIIKVAGAYYTALFPSTFAALEDAMKRFPKAAAISAFTVSCAREEWPERPVNSTSQLA